MLSGKRIRFNLPLDPPCQRKRQQQHAGDGFHRERDAGVVAEVTEQERRQGASADRSSVEQGKCVFPVIALHQVRHSAVQHR